MLKERISYREGLPINITIAEIDEYPIHFHDELEVVYVLKGSIKLRNGHYIYTLKKGNVYVLNDKEMHSFSRIEGKENMVMMMQMDLKYFAHYYEMLRNNFFVTDLDDDDDEALDTIRNTLANMVLEIVRKGTGYREKIIERAHNLIANLQMDFQCFLMEDGKFVNEKQKRGNKILAGRLMRITDYMYENYYRKLTLQEIAEREHLSIYYLSHVIKEATGLSFQNLLSFIRVEESEKLLLGTSKRIGTISSEVGFSAVRYYVHHFESWFGVHPEEYRKQYTGQIISRTSSSQLRMCSAAEIQQALKAQVTEGHFSYPHLMDMETRIISRNVKDEVKIEGGELSLIQRLMTSEIMEIISEPYRSWLMLKENILEVGEDYIISGAACEGNLCRDMSILIYNMDGRTMKMVEKASNVRELHRAVDEYHVKKEFLVKLTGLSGEYTVYRYKVERENNLMNLNRVLESDCGYWRTDLIRKWEALPAIGKDKYRTADGLNIRTTIDGFGGELIIVNKIG